MELLSPSPLHLLALLVLLTVFAFRARADAPLRRWRFLLLAASAWCWLASTPVFVNWLALQLENRYPPVAAHDALPPRPVIVVLSSGSAFEPSVPDDLQLNLAGYRRAQAGVELWRRTDGSLVFAGALPFETTAVSARMALLATKFGVPTDAIRIETRSSNTHENLRNAAAMIESGRPVIIVTSATHMPRAMAVARKLCLDAIAAPADFRGKRRMSWRAWLPDAGTRPFLERVLHEWLGLAWYVLRGYASLEDAHCSGGG
ncbi:MAG TPA: YdcF family protein [Gammaproteobacteria bacterium]